ncbi:MAG: molybdate ABC transporter permease subunit [Oscillochloris sp.]|nr:molybdate ABC transporter permease subunit [Oscillochloris sp.]
MESPLSSQRTIVAAPPRPQLRKRLRELSIWLFAAPLLVFLLLPLLAMVLRLDWRHFWTNLLSNGVLQAVSLSFITTMIATALTVTLGTPLALGLARREFRGRIVIDTLIDLPMILPPSVAGIALLIAFGRRGMIGGPLADLGIQIAFTQVAVIMAQCFVAAPYYVKSATAGFRSIDRELEQAAALDGANRWQVLRMITIPLAWPVLLGGAVMSWARALGEFGATIIFAGNLPGRTQTMPLAIYLGFERDLNLALTLAVILLVISFAALALVKGVLHQRIGV